MTDLCPICETSECPFHELDDDEFEEWMQKEARPLEEGKLHEKGPC